MILPVILVRECHEHPVTGLTAWGALERYHTITHRHPIIVTILQYKTRVHALRRSKARAFGAKRARVLRVMGACPALVQRQKL